MNKKRLSYLILTISTSCLMLIPATVRAHEMSKSIKTEEVSAKIESIKNKSKTRIEALKAKAEARTKEVRSKACDARKTNIENRLANRVEVAERHKSTFDSIYTRVKDFADKKSLTTAEITALRTGADTASQKVNDEVSALQLLNVNLDCTNPDNVAITIDTYKDQLVSVKTALKDYREAIRKYSQAVKKLAEGKEGAEQ